MPRSGATAVVGEGTGSGGASAQPVIPMSIVMTTAGTPAIRHGVMVVLT
ncbi:hypothetical protein K2F54_09880 [Cryobacterium sp. 1639]|nr:hypothetical protein [Cryobacterium sp. 1639]MBX0300283.1 hypothetical protein [Cryobacterium sp. 1639]